MAKSNEGTIFENKARGPRVNPGTVRIYGNGIARIAADIVPDGAQAFVVKYQCFKGTTVIADFGLGPETDVLTAAPFSKPDWHIWLVKAAKTDKNVFRCWKSNPGAASVLVSLTGVLKSIGLDEKDYEGEYQAVVDSYGGIEVYSKNKRS